MDRKAPREMNAKADMNLAIGGTAPMHIIRRWFAFDAHTPLADAFSSAVVHIKGV
jgi:hypothetical protein